MGTDRTRGQRPQAGHGPVRTLTRCSHEIEIASLWHLNYITVRLTGKIFPYLPLLIFLHFSKSPKRESSQKVRVEKRLEPETFNHTSYVSPLPTSHVKDATWHFRLHSWSRPKLGAEQGQKFWINFFKFWNYTDLLFKLWTQICSCDWKGPDNYYTKIIKNPRKNIT